MENQGQVPIEEKKEIDFEIIKGRLYQITEHQIKSIETDEWVVIRREVQPIVMDVEKTKQHMADQRKELVKKQKEQLDEFDAMVTKLDEASNGQKDSTS